MLAAAAPDAACSGGRKRHGVLIALAGILVGQAVLYGPSLVGRKILLPLDALAQPGVYLPSASETTRRDRYDPVSTDVIFVMEPARRFAAAELHEGRLPLWTPYQYTGAPVSAVWSRYSPFLLLASVTDSPLILPWIELLMAVVAGLGAYMFFRRALGVGVWPAAVAAWCFPLTGFFIFWQGFRTASTVVWLPWLLLAVARAVRRPDGVHAVAVGVTTSLVLVCGQADVAAQVLLVSGLVALWLLIALAFVRRQHGQAGKAVLVLALGWVLGLALASPNLLPQWDYTLSGSRLTRRAAGEEVRPPFGLAALPQVVLPDLYGATHAGSFRVVAGNQNESSAAAYPGLFVALVLAPLAWTNRRYRALNLLWCGLGFLGLAWCLNVPGLVSLMRLPGLNMLSHNRFVFATSFALLALGAVGLESLAGGQLVRRWWFWLPTAVLSGLAIFCVYRAFVPPLQGLVAQAEQGLVRGDLVDRARVLARLQEIHDWFVGRYVVSAVLCSLGALAWLFLWRRPALPTWTVSAAGLLLLGDLLWFGYGRSAQSDPALYFPPVPALEEIGRAAPGRVVGYHCLPAALPQALGIRDIRGYDAVDPSRLIDLLKLGAGGGFRVLPYAYSQWYVPRLAFTASGQLQLSPIMDMLNVRYVVFRGTPPDGFRPAFRSPDYWVMVNPNALPRAFVPRRVELIRDDGARLARLAAPEFDPREVAFVETPVNLPAGAGGRADITVDQPTRVQIAAHMASPGMVVLADLWEAGWQAYLDGRSVPILRANHTLRGVVLPAGDAILELRYEPAVLDLGLIVAGLAAMVALGIALVSARRRRSDSASRAPCADQVARSA